MPNPPRLTKNQLLILDQAANLDDGAFLPLPPELELQGRTRTIALESLLERSLIEQMAPKAPSLLSLPCRYQSNTAIAQYARFAPFSASRR